MEGTAFPENFRSLLMNASRPELSPYPGPGSFLAGVSLFAAIAWLISRVWLGLDFTDEMQYYGEITSLARTGRFFQNDLFVQQLGYLFVLPFFKLHALIFPDQSYLILFGRLLLLAGYGAVGALFWRVASRAGRFSAGQKLAGLAAFFSWVPFQIFAFSYNSTSYLVIVALVAVWIDRDAGGHLPYLVKVSILLVVLAFTHPPAGLALILVAATEAATWRGWRGALGLLAATTLCTAVMGVIILVLHGPGFIQDLGISIQFSRAFPVGDRIKIPAQFASCLILVATHGLFIVRVYLGKPFRYPFGADCPMLLRWVILMVILSGGGVLIRLIASGQSGFLSVSGCFGLLMLLAASVDPTNDRSQPSSVLLQRVITAALVIGYLTLLALGLSKETGFFAAAVLMVMLGISAVFSGAENQSASAKLAGVAGVAGVVFSFASSNGVQNFGIGAAGVIPFLVLHCSPPPAGAMKPARITRLIGSLAPPVLTFLLVINGTLHPYREQNCWNHFEPIDGVPAFQGIRSSAIKIEALKRFTQTPASAELRGKRILVAGPHPWLYFALGGEPATAMFFMHLSGQEIAYELIAARLGQGNPPDAILLTSTTLPRSIAARIDQWRGQDYATQTISLPPEFIQGYLRQTGYDISKETILLHH